jgi:hypothetical protein
VYSYLPQVTLNNLTVGRSVLEALRLLEAFQAVAKHGVLCPVDWRPSSNTTETMKTISNTLTESYEDRLANLQKDFGHEIVVTDLDAKHKQNVDQERSELSSYGTNSSGGDRSKSPKVTESVSRKNSRTVSFSAANGEPTIVESPNECLPSSSATFARPALVVRSSTSTPPNANPTPMSTPQKQEPPTITKITTRTRGAHSPPKTPFPSLPN